MESCGESECAHGSVFFVHRYTLTVWTGHNDPLTLKEMLLYRKEFEMSRIYYDLPDSVRTEIAMHGST